MPTALLLLTLAQFSGLSMWTDPEGVVHVAATTQAPQGSRVLEGGSYSVIDGDSRPLVMPDGGARTDDSRWWRSRFQRARQAVETTQALERDARHDLELAQREQCVSATARAGAQVRVTSPRPALVTVTGPQGTRQVRVGRGTSVLVDEHDEQTSRSCQRGVASSAMVTALQARRSEREQAELELRRLEQEALAGRVPVRDWY